MENRCVCCGEIIPEGRQVCPACEAGVTNFAKAVARKAESKVTLGQVKENIMKDFTEV